MFTVGVLGDSGPMGKENDRHFHLLGLPLLHHLIKGGSSVKEIRGRREARVPGDQRSAFVLPSGFFLLLLMGPWRGLPAEQDFLPL